MLKVWFVFDIYSPFMTGVKTAMPSKLGSLTVLSRIRPPKLKLGRVSYILNVLVDPQIIIPSLITQPKKSMLNLHGLIIEKNKNHFNFFFYFIYIIFGQER